MKIIVCNTFFKRLKGNMFKRNIEDILIFPKCNSIHTFFMFKKINVIMLDKNKNIVYQKVIKPWRIVLPKKHAYYTVELPDNMEYEKKIDEYLSSKYTS